MDDVARQDEILRFWLGPEGAPPLANQARWFTADPQLDEEIRTRFGADLEAAARGERDGWADTPRGALALVVLLDQFSRNAGRGTPRAFAQDARALRVAEDAIARGFDARLGLIERWFLYMPYMHTEDHAAQQRCVALFARLADEAPPELRAAFAGALDYAERHRVIVERFGRFPHRNAILGRASTQEELAFLTQPGSAF
jgi:uncharacterized protein (DUF924 family)